MLTTLATWHDMVQSQLRTSLAAVLAGIPVALKNLAARELSTVQRFANHVHEANHLRAFKHSRDGVDVIDTALNRFGFAFAK